MESSSHPIRLAVSDDRRRSRLTVFFRLLLALPHLLWLTGWSLVVSFAVLANWLAVVISGETPPVFHGFFGAYVRYATHVGAYVCLAANPFPGFRGRPGYPVDVELGPPARQSRLGAGFRLLLAIPAALLASMLGGLGNGGYVVGTTALLLWFAALALGRAPRGLTALTAYGLGYSAQALAYGLLVTGRYPDSHPDRLLPGTAVEPHPVRLRLEDGLRRSRLTTALRFPLSFPHFVWLAGWGGLAVLAVLASWLATLVRGRSPRSLHRFIAAYVRYLSHVTAFVTVVGNPFPGFVGREGSYPVEIVIAPPEAQHRLVTLFRLPLAVPALLLSNVLSAVLMLAAVGLWLTALARGSAPSGLRALGAALVRYQAQATGYVFLLTDRYPDSTPTLRAAPPPLVEETA